MIDKKRFYKNDKVPGKFKRNRMWNEIKNSVFITERRFNRSSLDLKSFVFGMSFTILVFIIAIGAIKLIPNIIYDSKSENIKLNRAYSKAAEELENSIPNFVTTLDKSERTRELLNARLEELYYINDAIHQYKMKFDQSDFTKIKQDRLLELYQSKIDAINKIIQLKGDSWL